MISFIDKKKVTLSDCLEEMRKIRKRCDEFEEKIIVNEYVRTRAGFIYKITNIDKNGVIYLDKKQSVMSKQDLEDYTVKHSKQLIDLIEDKDIVEIELSEEFVEKKDKKKLIQIGDIYTKETLQKDIDNGIITRILTILSYNQCMANCYKVGGEDEC